MSNLLVSPKWNSFINKVDAGEEITGGDLGNANIATRQLAENVMFLRDSMFTLVADATGDLSQAIVESNKKTKDEFDIVAGLIEAQNEIIIAEAKARKEAISASNDKIAEEAAERVRELGVQSVALQKEIDDRKEAFRLEHISRAESEAKFTEDLEEVLTEAEASVKKVENLSSQLIGGYDGSNLDFVTEGLLFQQKTVTSTAIKGMAEQISMLSAGVGEQFDTAEIWHFDKDKEDWINGVFDVGYLTVKSETVTSPTFSIDGDVYHHLKMRINKVGSPDWAGKLVWDTGSIALPEPVFVDDVTLVTLDTTWSGDITQLQLKLSTDADDTNYYKIDWITIGRPSPGASTASVLDLKIATATRDEALAQDIRGLSTKMDTDNALLSSNVNAKLETITTQQQTQATDITTLSSNVDTMNTKLSADIVLVNSTLVTKETALAESIAALTSKTNESEASVLTQLQTLTDVDSALGTQVDALTASFDESAAAITAQNLVFAAEDLAQATQISQLTAKVDGNIAEVNTQIETLTNAESANANKFTSITAEFQALNDKTDASDAEIRTNAADIIEERNARATDILAQATRIDVLTTEVGENAASATTRINLLSLEDQALAERLDVLTASTDDTTANINSRLTALADEDSAFSEQLTQVMAAVDDNDSAVHERVTALTTATDAEAEKLTLLAAEVGANSAEILTTSRAAATNSGAIAEFNTRLTVDYLPKVENIASNILNAVKQTDVQYYLSISESQPLGGEWLTTAPTWEPSKYMFQRMETTYVDGTIKHTPGINGTNISGAKGDKGLDGKDGSDGVAGLQGPSGTDGLRGPAGKDGESSYTHLAYATSKNGDGFSTGYFETATYIGMYVDNIKEDSENYALYNWSLIKGADGTNGIPGPKGTDGKTSYLHIAYANSPDGAEGFSTTASIGKTYIGQYTDFELEDSTNYALYSWTLIKGEKGDQGPIGLTGLEGPKGDKGIQGPMGPMGPRGPEGLRGLTGLEGLQGDQGIRGEKGEDGLSSYTHIAYATSVTGTNFNTGHFEAATYIGMYVDNDKTDSTDPSTYKWSLIKGADGANGIPGPKGTDGKTSYLHIAYANNVTGNIGFSTTISEGKTHIGQYTDFKLEDSDDYTKYNWTLIKGDKGDTGPMGLQGVPGIEGKAGANGIQGPKGADGTSSYTHLAYATSVTGTNFNTAWYPTATYIGMYVDRTEEDSEVPSKYNWSLIKGADGANGIAGPKGADGKTTYLHIAYANSEAGDVGFSTTVSAGKAYIGQYTDTTLGDSEDYSIYTWSLIKGADGLSSYAHLAYATSATGTNFNTNHFQGATYIGMYVDNEEDDSTDYTKYNWSLIKGADGAEGIPGPTGEDGKTSYLHVAYATSATGAVGFSTTVSEGKTYIGQYTDFEKVDSPSYTKYKWSLIKGDKGDKGDQGIQGPIGLTGLEGPVGATGIQGPKGANGLNSYTHIAYATSADGLDFSTGHFEGATYIGMYVDNTEEDSDVYSKYNWSLIKGADGDKGIPGPTGADGKTAYLHIAYATSATGNTGFSTTVSAGKTYIGQYTDNELTDSPTYTRYKWTLIKGDKGAKGDQGIQGPIGLTGLTGLEGEKGDQGIQGPKGADGLNSYTHLAYATSANGALFSTSWFEAATYIGMYVDNTETDSSSPSAYNWSLIKGADGAQGIPGVKGTDGNTSYLHIAYATSPTGNTGFSTTISVGKTYIGQYTDFEKADSGSYTKYKWSLIKGEKGDQGPIGLTGLEGPKGDQGIQGPKGDQGPIGLTGLPGLEGAKGDQGIQGPKGSNGLNSYTHLAYATGPLGEGIQTEWYADATYIGMYVDNIATDSTVASKYKWSLIKGADGANGIQGPTGPDGKTAYLHIAYATSANGVDGFSTTVSTGKTYIGQYTDNTLTDSKVPSKYKWTLIKGADGLNSYTHIAYATGPLGQGIKTEWFEAATYIGMYVDNTETDSIIATDYNWSLIKGADGAQGIPGKAGADGLKTYLHIAYATSANGAIGFSTTVSEGKTYIGQYTDNTLEDSVTYSKYKWSLIKGDKGDKGDQGIQGPIGLTGITGLEGPKGDQGIQGPKGANGLNSYTHIAYATSVTGNEFSTSWFEAATYIGMYTDNTLTDSTVVTKYKWSLIKGADGNQGIAGPTGADGKTAYLHIAYATSANGSVGFSTTVSAGKTYIGQYTDNELTDSPTYTKYKWTLIKGDKGDKGDQGPIGLTGVRGLEGAKGDQGIQGPKGVDGLNSYTHLAYATGPAGQGIKTAWFEAATYIGMYVDNTATDSTDATKYKWSLIKGADGANGIQGPTGTDGKTAYLHIAYATSATGNTGFSTTVSAGKTYIGQYTDNELVDSQVYTKYKWTLIKGDKGDQGIQGIQGPAGLRGLTGLEGPKGDQGIQGPVGANGLNSYTHLAYATGSAGQGIKTEWFAAATYIGMYVDNTETDSTDATKYKWSLIKGADGNQGIAGPKGTDGKTAYLHIAYATSANGSVGFSTTVSAGKAYIGQYTDNELTDSQTYTKYKWTLIKGETGEKGATGDKGATGATGAVGQGIDSVTEQYAVSTSKTVVPTTWTTVMPEWSYGLYVWSRSMIKLKNPVATEYTTPIVDSSWEAVNNINVGGRNLLRESNVAVSNNVYAMKSYVLTEAPTAGDDIVITIWGTLGADRTSFGAYNSGGNVSIGTLKLVSPGIYRYVGKWVKGAASDTFLQIYQFTNAKTSASTINAIKLEKGNIGTEWSPAPEDTATAIQGSLDIGNSITNEFGKLVAETKVLTEIGGKISGWKNYNNGNTSSFDILADNFSVGNSGVMKKPFSIVGNDITFNGKVSFNSMTDTEVIDKAVSDINNLDIGGRNLFLGNPENNEVSIPAYGANDGYLTTLHGISIDPAEEVGNIFTVSFEIWGETAHSVVVYNSNRKLKYFMFQKEQQVPASKWTKLWYTFTCVESSVNTSTRYGVDFYARNSTTSKVRNIKIERGNKATDWAPAPENTNLAIAQSLTDAKTYADGLDTYIKGAFKNGIIEEAEAKAIRTHIAQLTSEKEEIAQKYTTIYANSNLLGAFKTNLASANTAYNTAHKSLVDYINSSISNGAVTTAQSAAIATRFTTYQGAIKTLTQRFEEASASIIAQTETNAITYTDSIEIGGRNLIVLSASGIVEGSYLNATGAATTSASWFITDNIPVTSGASYILSGYRNLGSSPSTVFYNAAGTYISGIAGTARRIVTAPANATSMKISLEIADKPTVKSEKGHKATDWTPAPEDVDASIASKAKTFVTTPTVPYSIGDFWKDGNTVKVCTTARLTGAYTASDWTLVGDITSSNTSADTAKVNGISSATVATNAANGATVYADVMSDLKITPVEKTAINQEWNRIQKEYASLLAQAQALSVATTTYTAAYTGLSTTAPAMSTILASMSTTTTLTAAQRDAYKTQYTTYYTQAVAIIKAINDKIAANAKAQADAKSKTFTAQPVPPYTAGDLWKDGTTIKVCTVTRASGSYTAADWTLVGDVTSANTAANSNQLGGTAAATVLDNAAKGLATYNDVMSDLKITPVEKTSLNTEWTRIKAEYTSLLAHAVSLSVSTTAFTTAYNALNSTSPTMTSILSSMVTTTTLTAAQRDALRTQFTNYYAQVTVLNKGISDKVADNAKAYTDAIEIGGTNLFSITSSGITKGKYLLITDAQTTSSTWGISDYIPVKPGKSYTWSGYSSVSSPANNFYDIDKVFISGFTGNNRLTMVAPAGAAFLRVSYQTKDINITKVEQGNKATDWSPAPEDVALDATTKADAAKTAAQEAAQLYADLNDKIIVIDSKTKKFLNPSSYSSASSAHTGYLIIETPIKSARMVTIDITGYNHQANKASIDLSVSFYISGTTFSNFDYVDTGTYPIENVRLGLIGGSVVIIVGNATSTWAYPKIDVTHAIIGYTASPDTYKDGWVTRIANTITDITNVRDMSNIYSTSLKGIQNNVYYPATTEIHGGNIRTKTIAADSIVANSITAGQIAANAITATQIAANTITAAKMTTDSITARELKSGTVAATHIVGNTITGDKLVVDAITSREIKANAVTATQISVTNLSSINSNLGTITGGSLNINNKFKVDALGNMTASSGTFSGTVSGGDININNKFKVSATGEVNISSSTTGSRLVVTNELISVYDSAGKLRVKLGLW